MFEKGSYEECDTVIRKLLDVAGSNREEKTHEILIYIHHLHACSNHRQGRLDIAKEMFADNIKQLNACTVDPSNIGLKLSTLNILGLNYEELGLLKEAEESCQQALEICMQSFGEEHLYTWATKKFLIDIYFSQGRYIEAVKLSAQLLNANRYCFFAVKSPSNTLHNLSLAAEEYVGKSLYKEAEQIYLTLFESRRLTLSENRLLAIKPMRNLADIYSKQEQWTKCERLRTQLLGTCEIDWGADHRDTIEAMEGLAVACRQLKQYAKCEDLMLRVLRFWQKGPGEESHTKAVNIMYLLASTHWEQQRYTDCANLLLRALDSGTEKLGNHYAVAMDLMSCIASAFLEKQQYAEYVDLETKLLHFLKKAMGESHPDTIRTMYDIAAVYKRLDRYDEAEALCVQAERLNAEHCKAEAEAYE